MIRAMFREFMFSYWYSQAQYARMRLQEIDAEERNLLDDREKVKNRVNKADTKCAEYARVIT